MLISYFLFNIFAAYLDLLEIIFILFPTLKAFFQFEHIWINFYSSLKSAKKPMANVMPWF